MSVLIKGGHIVTAVDDYVGDILIEGETIAASAPRSMALPTG